MDFLGVISFNFILQFLCSRTQLKPNFINQKSIFASNIQKIPKKFVI